MAIGKTRRATRRGGQWNWATVRAAGALVAMVLAAYVLVVGAGFIWDDNEHVVSNDTLRSLDGLRRIWLEIGAVPQYYPLVHTTFWAEYHVWGLTPAGYHVVNVLLHATSAVLLWRLLVRLGVPGAWFGAALFAVHPVEVESVAWVTERKNVLSLLLALASMLAYLRFAPVYRDDAGSASHGRVRWRWYAAALALFVAALLSKTVVATLPAVLLVVIWWKRGRIAWRDVLALVPFFALGVGLGLVTVWVEKHHVGAVGEIWALSPVERFLVAGRALWFYAGKLAWPYPLVFFYPRWTIDSSAWWQYLFPGAALVVIVALWLARRHIGRGPLAAVLIFAGVLVPAIGFFDVYPFRFSFVADHFEYHASVALLALAAAGGALAAWRLPSAQRDIPKLVAAALLVALSATTAHQTLIYRNLETLYRHTLAYNPNSWIAYANLSTYLRTTGRLDEALELVREGMARGLQEPMMHNNLGGLLYHVGKRDGFRRGQLEEVISHYRTAIQLDPGYTAPRFNMAQALLDAQQPEQAIEQLREVLASNPTGFTAARAHLEIGKVLLQGRKPQAAAVEFREAGRLHPAWFDAVFNLGAAQLMMRQFDEAIGSFNQALRLDPTQAAAKVALQKALDGKWGRGSNK